MFLIFLCIHFKSLVFSSWFINGFFRFSFSLDLFIEVDQFHLCHNKFILWTFFTVYCLLFLVFSWLIVWTRLKCFSLFFNRLGLPFSFSSLFPVSSWIFFPRWFSTTNAACIMKIPQTEIISVFATLANDCPIGLLLDS